MPCLRPALPGLKQRHNHESSEGTRSGDSMSVLYSLPASADSATDSFLPSLLQKGPDRPFGSESPERAARAK